MFLCFSFLQVFRPSFFHHFLFLFITFRIHLLFHFLFVWPLIFLISFFLNSVFLNNFPFVSKKLINLSFFTRMRYLCMSFCSWICSSVVSFSSCFLFSNTCVSLFLLLSSLSITSLKDKFVELLQIWKKTCLSISLFVGHFSYLFVFACFFFFSKFLFFCFILMCFWTFFFLSSRSWLFFPLSLPFYVSLFHEDSVWFDHRFSFLFYFLLLHTVLLFTRRHVFWIVSVCKVSFFF